MKFDHTTICKPVILRELLFYKSLNEDLKQFTPKYHGRRVNLLIVLNIVMGNTGGILSHCHL